MPVAVAETAVPAPLPATSFEKWVAELAEENLIDAADPSSASNETFFDADKWPAETVFVPTSESAEDEPAESEEQSASQFEFEDEEADDFFEQSLSGLKLTDIEPDESADEGIDEDARDAEVTTEDLIPEQQTIEAAEVAEPVVTEVVPELATPTEIGSSPPISFASDLTEYAPSRSHRSWGKTITRVGLTILLSAVMYIAGVMTGFWFVARSMPKVPDPTDVQVVSENKLQNAPPAGMAYVPGGEFLMGSNEGDAFSRPAHNVNVQPFFIDITEVTNEAYFEFVKATGHTLPLNWKDGTFKLGEEKFPVTGVNYYDALEYAAWAGKRLPTEAEWEFAARGNDGRIYPWGNEWAPENANAGGVSVGIRNVGEGASSPFGLFDMIGNAWEWTKSDARTYPGGKEIPWSRLKLKVIRGGNWQSSPVTATAVFRGFYGASGERKYESAGFRCVKDIAKD